MACASARLAGVWCDAAARHVPSCVPVCVCVAVARCSMIALRDGKEPPTALPSRAPAAVAAPAGERSAAPRGVDGESFVEREMRLQREASERLRAKFGEGGLKGQSVSGGYMPPEEPAAPEYARLTTHHSPLAVWSTVTHTHTHARTHSHSQPC
jgi:hypothetical protein